MLYDAADLVTHAVILGMTGSGKTGLGIDLIEEAAIDGVPVLAVDPKGDLSNLLLTFPGLTASEFAPWINPDEARLLGMTPEAFAEREAKRWREGLAEWGQGPDRIARLRQAAEFSVYTPGSRAARPLSILRTFQAPGAAISGDPELLAERASAAATSVLTLAGIDAEPRRSREHILVSTLLTEAWQTRPVARSRRRSSARCSRRRSSASACSSSTRSSRPPIASRSPRISIACSRRPTSPCGSRASRSTSTRCSTTPRASRASRCSRSRTSTIASGCSSSRCSSTRSCRGCGCSAAPRRCARSSTSTR